MKLEINKWKCIYVYVSLNEKGFLWILLGLSGE